MRREKQERKRISNESYDALQSRRRKKAETKILELKFAEIFSVDFKHNCVVAKKNDDFSDINISKCFNNYFVSNANYI